MTVIKKQEEKQVFKIIIFCGLDSSVNRNVWKLEFRSILRYLISELGSRSGKFSTNSNWIQVSIPSTSEKSFHFFECLNIDLEHKFK